MNAMTSHIIYIGVKAHVAAIDKTDGRTLWQTKLKGAAVSGERFVSLLVEEGRVYAHSYGELFCLDSETGKILWSNPLDGLGYDIATIATEGASNTSLAAAEYRRRREAAAASAAGAGGIQAQA